MPPTSSRLRVTQVSTYRDPAHRAPAELLRAWRDFGASAAAAQRAGVDMTVVQASWTEAVHTIGGVSCQFVELPAFRDQIAATRPDVIHWQGLIYPSELRALARQLPSVPIVAQDHGSGVPGRFWRRWFHGWGFSPLAGVMFTATDQALAFKAAGVLRADLPVFEVVEGSTPFAPGDVATARRATGIDGDPCLLWVGNLDANKDPLMVLDAVSAVAAGVPGVRLWMCYRFAPLLEQVRARIAGDPAIRDRVRLVGEVAYPGIEEHFRAADFLVQASHKEGSGYGVIEALACGTTPLVTDIPSFRTITGQGSAGAVVPTGDSTAMARVIREWAGRDRAELRTRARHHFEQALSFDAIGRQMVAAYRRLGRVA